MVRITQLGTGNALVVEDETNPDSSPFVVKGDGSVGIGTTNPTTTLQVNGTTKVETSIGSTQSIWWTTLDSKNYSSKNVDLLVQPETAYSFDASQTAGRLYEPTIFSHALTSANESYVSTLYSFQNQTNLAGTASNARINGIGFYNYVTRNSITDISSYASNFLLGINNSIIQSTNVDQSVVTGFAYGINNLVGIQKATATNIYGSFTQTNVGVLANYSASSTNTYGSYNIIQVGAASGTGIGTLTNYYGYYVAPTVALTGQLTNYYGLYLATPIVSGTLTNRYSIYSSDASSPMYHAGSVGIGTTNPTSKLQVAGNVTPSATNTYDLGTSSLGWNKVYAQEFNGQFIGNADSATRLATPRTIDIDGDVIGVGIGTTFDGSQNVTIQTTLKSQGLTPSVYGSSILVPVIGVNTAGIVTSITTTGVNFSAATVAQANGLTTARTIAITGDLTYTSPAFDGTGNVTATGTLATIVGLTPNSYGSGSQVATFTVDAKGRITGAANTSITGINASSVSAAGADTQVQYNDGTTFAGKSTFTFQKTTDLLTVSKLSLTGTGSATVGQLTFGGTTNNWIDFGTLGVAAPSFSTRSVGTKIVLYNSVSGSQADYAFGIESSTLWSSVYNTSAQFKWYGGTTLAATLSGTGNFTAVGAISGTTLTSTVATETAPLTVTSTTQVTNLNSNYVNGLTATQFFNNMGNNHSTRTDFNASTNFGFNYVQGSTNGPGIPSATQYYNLSIGLGNDYAYSAYAMEFAIPRTPAGGLPYPSVRFREAGTWGSWSKIYAGFADSATSATTATNQSGGTVSATTGSFSSTLTVGGAIVRSAAGVGYLSGNYSSSESVSTSGAIYTIGGSYVPTSSTLGTMYGIGYGYAGNGGIGNPGGVGNSIWGMYVASAGAARIFLDSDNGRGHFASYVVASNITSGGNVTGSSASCTGNAGTATTANGLNTSNNYQVSSLGIGTAASGTAGEIRATNNVTAYYSDERLKENIKPITSALSKLLTLRGVTFNSNKVAEQYGYEDKKEQVGVIAQDVEKVLPQVVVPAPFDIAQDEDGNEYSKSGENYKTVHYDKLVPLLIEATKDQQNIILDLRNRLENLESI